VQTITTPAENTANAITIKSTGTGGATDDISEKFAEIRFCPQPA